MWSQLLIGVGGLVFLALLFALFRQVGNRARALAGDCSMDSLRCLGCLATGRCRAKGQSPAAPSAAPRRTAAHRP